MVFKPVPPFLEIVSKLVPVNWTHHCSLVLVCRALVTVGDWYVGTVLVDLLVEILLVGGRI